MIEWVMVWKEQYWDSRDSRSNILIRIYAAGAFLLYDFAVGG